MDYVAKDALVIRGGGKMKKRKRCQIQTPKEPPKDKHGKMKSHLGEELCYQFAWGTYSPQRVQKLAQLACQDIDLCITSKDPSSATVLGGTVLGGHSSGTVLGATSKDPSSATVLGGTVLGGHSSGTVLGATSKDPSRVTSKDPHIELRQLSAIGYCGKHSNNCHRDLMNILEEKSMMPMPHKLAVEMSPSLAF
jgi:hypothetical protein